MIISAVSIWRRDVLLFDGWNRTTFNEGACFRHSSSHYRERNCRSEHNVSKSRINCFIIDLPKALTYLPHERYGRHDNGGFQSRSTWVWPSRFCDFCGMCSRPGCHECNHYRGLAHAHFAAKPAATYMKLNLMIIIEAVCPSLLRFFDIQHKTQALFLVVTKFRLKPGGC